MITFSKLGRYGRIGNQMFQYAALVGVSKKTGFDYGITIHKSDDIWNCFNLDDIFELDIKPFEGEITNQYCEPYYSFCDDIFNIPDNTDIHGYFQSTKYFEHCHDEILRQFTFKQEHLSKVKQYGTNFTSIHVRRGDYIGSGNFYACHMMNYYNKACDIIGDDKYLVFSDGIDWCNDNFVGDKFVVVDDLNDYESLCLMSRAKNNIIANSSFSWWASYLNPNPNKRIVAPIKWFGDLQRNVEDLYMGNWILV